MEKDHESKQGPEAPSDWHRAIFDEAPDGIVLVDEEGIIRDANPGAAEMFGYEQRDLVGRPVEVLVPDDLRDGHVAHRQGYVDGPRRRPMGIGMELQGRRRDGSTLPVEIGLSPVEHEEGRFVVAVVRDVSERRRLRSFGQASLRAAEEERQRIARELHDDTAQALSTLLLRLAVARRAPDTADVGSFLEEIQEEISEIVGGIRRISRGLHPPALQEAGVVPALKGHVRSLREAPGVRAEVAFEATSVDGELREDERLVVYRVVQEALSNAVRHAEAGSIHVELDMEDGELRARVQDDGRGFDAEDRTLLGRGLGLTGMRERASLVGGALSVTSEPGEGTTVELRIPTDPEGVHHQGAARG